MTLKCIQVVYDSITERFPCTQGTRTKYFERYFLSPTNKTFNIQENNKVIQSERSIDTEFNNLIGKIKRLLTLLQIQNFLKLIQN